MPQGSASRSEREPGTEPRTGGGRGWKGKARAALSSGALPRPRTTSFTLNKPRSRERRGPRTGRGGGNFSDGGRRTESGEPSAAWHESGEQSGVGPGAHPVSPRWSPRRPQRLPPGSAPAGSGRLVCPRPLRVFLFLVPGRASGSEEPGETVPGGAAPPPATGHVPGEAARPGPSPGRGRGVLRPELGPGRSDLSRAEGLGQATPGGGGAAPPTDGRWLLLPPPPARPWEELEAVAPPPPPRDGADWVAARGKGLGPETGVYPRRCRLRTLDPNEFRLQPTWICRPF